MKIWFGRILALLLVTGAAGAIGFVFWAQSAADPMPEAVAALENSERVLVQTGDWLAFAPTGSKPQIGLILYPGGRVDPRAYAPAARAIASEGYLVVIVPMPLNLAVFGVDRAVGVLEAFPEVQTWAIGGHSLGGAMAAGFAEANPDKVEGLVLWASYPAESDDLSEASLPVVSIFGSQDGLATVEEMEASRRLLPPDTSFVGIEGGNHAQFGWYGTQSGDGEAGLSREDQQRQVIVATLALLDRISADR